MRLVSNIKSRCIKYQQWISDGRYCTKPILIAIAVKQGSILDLSKARRRKDRCSVIKPPVASFAACKPRTVVGMKLSEKKVLEILGLRRAAFFW